MRMTSEDFEKYGCKTGTPMLLISIMLLFGDF
jgi:hypothetical protein